MNLSSYITTPKQKRHLAFGIALLCILAILIMAVFLPKTSYAATSTSAFVKTRSIAYSYDSSTKKVSATSSRLEIGTVVTISTTSVTASNNYTYYKITSGGCSGLYINRYNVSSNAKDDTMLVCVVKAAYIYTDAANETTDKVKFPLGEVFEVNKTVVNTFYEITSGTYAGTYIRKANVTAGVLYSKGASLDVVTNVESLSVYSMPDASAGSVLSLAEAYSWGNVISVSPFVADWFIATVELEGGTAVYGFVPAASIALYTKIASDENLCGIVIKKSISLYSAPSTQSPVKSTRSYSYLVSCVAFNDTFYMASLDDSLVFICTSDIQLRTAENATVRKCTLFRAARGYSVPVANSDVLKTFAKGSVLVILPWDESGTWYAVACKIDDVTRFVFVAASNFQVEYSSYDLTLSKAVSLQKSHSLVYSDGSWVRPSDSTVEYYLKPSNFPSSSNNYYQFMDLQGYSGVTAAEINKFLSENCKGTSLEGQGASFVAASKASGVNEIYLVAHACLETGYGASWLASGYKDTYEGTTASWYNFYGYGATDSEGSSGGLGAAHYYGWTSPAKAIKGAASLIGKYYIYATDNTSLGYDQNTVYKMRFNPDAMEKGSVTHQYASDIAWAKKIGNIMGWIYNDYVTSSYEMKFDIPVYE